MLVKRWPFVITALLLFLINIFRLNSNQRLRVYNDPVCAVFFVGYLFCCAVIVSIRSNGESK